MSEIYRYYAVSLVDAWALTSRKQYDILDEVNGLIKIKDDMDKECWYDDTSFTIVSEYNMSDNKIRPHKAPKKINKQKDIK